MSPEALIGMEVGKSVLRRLLGQGTMGTVYLATQPQGLQVAVKVFVPASRLEQPDHEEFQKRLAQVIAQGAFLKHKHILGVIDYGQQSSLLYQMMPYIAGESLQQLLTRTGPLPFAQIQLYLEQLAGALDYAHAHGVLHRDIKPENILLAPDGNLFLADFGLAGLATEKMFARVRRATPGMLNAIAPEYVLSKPADERADLYSLGIVLYHMVTGRPPFQSASLIEVAMQHARATPPAPGSLRTDLPEAAAQVILRALAKIPAERYSRAQELATMFRQAIVSGATEKRASDVQSTLLNGTTSTRLAAPRNGGLFDPKWRALAATASEASGPAPAEPSADQGLRRPGLLHLSNLPANALDTQAFAEQPTRSQQPAMDHLLKPNDIPDNPTEGLRFSAAHSSLANVDLSSVHPPMFNANEVTRAIKPVNIGQMPAENGASVAGVQPIQPDGLGTSPKKRRAKHLRTVGFVLVALIIVAGSGIFWFTQNAAPQLAPAQIGLKPHVSATATATSSATASTNIIFMDNLDQNIHNWASGPQGFFNYVFKGGAYHISNADKTNTAPALLPGKVLSAPFAYSLTMEQLQGDLSSPNNQFGLLLDTNVQHINGQQIDTFYAFEVVNKPGGQYQFWKYDNSKDSAHPWTLLWHKDFGTEFRQGSGPAYANTLKVIATGKNFTFMVNGTQVGMWQDASFTSGNIGMLVNLNGAEVAFSHLLVTYP